MATESTHHTPRFQVLENGESITLHQLSSLELLGGDCLLENSQGKQLRLYNGEKLDHKFYHHTWDSLKITAPDQGKTNLVYTTVAASASPILSPCFYQFTAEDVQDVISYQLKNIRFLQLFGGDYEIQNLLGESIPLYNGQQLPNVFYRQYWDELTIRCLHEKARIIYLASHFQALL